MQRKRIDETISDVMQQIKAGVDDARNRGCDIPDDHIEVNVKLSTEDGRPVQVSLPLVLTEITE
jgi:hypothetical protein|tara:strand:+ start:69 stop:260 length:192 start_codon:yes stop_codon:yes gene_type:complete